MVFVGVIETGHRGVCVGGNLLARENRVSKGVEAGKLYVQVTPELPSR